MASELLGMPGTIGECLPRAPPDTVGPPAIPRSLGWNPSHQECCRRGRRPGGWVQGPPHSRPGCMHVKRLAHE